MVLQGVIRPPPEIRAVADRTALYVAKNGRAFETRILGSEKGKTPKFSFLHGTSPFHAYYEQRIQFYEQGGVDDEEKETQDPKKKTEEVGDKETNGGKPPGAVKKSLKQQVKTAAKSVIDPVAKAVLAQRSKIAQLRAQQQQQQHTDGDSEQQKMAASSSAVIIPPPPPLHFINVVPPTSLTAAQMETIQLVAQFTAMDQKQNFLQQLSSREWNNPQFAFCQPRHGHFCYFSALVDAYRQVLGTWTSTTATKTSGDLNGNNTTNGGDDLRNVETCLERAAYRAEYERDLQQQHKKNEETMLINWHDFVVVETIDFAADEVVELSAMMPPPPPQMPAALAGEQGGGMGGELEEEEEDEEEQETIRLVPNYQPKVVGADQKHKTGGSSMMVIDPITGKSVAVDDMPEHMRIQLLDPKWAEQRKIFQEKQKDSNLVSGDVVASNLARLAHARGDVNKEQDLLTKESDSKKRLAEANRVIREHAQGTVGPSLPQHQYHQHQQQQQGMMSSGLQEPAMKRPRVTTIEAPPMPVSQHGSRLLVPPPPPPGFESAIPGVPLASSSSALDDPFAASVSGVTTAAPPSFGLATDTSNSDHPSSTTPTSAANAGTTAPSVLLSESDFVASLEGGSSAKVTLQIRIPNDRTQVEWNFYGQIVSHVANIMSTVKEVKQELSRVLQVPANKIQLKSTTTGVFLKDNTTLAALNIGGPATGASTLELVPRARGGRK